MTRRRVMLVAGALALLFALTGCGGNDVTLPRGGSVTVTCV